MASNILFSQDKFPDFFEEMKMVCEQNQYDCNSNKIVTPYLYNSFFYKSEAKFLITLYLISTLVASMISIIAPLKAATFPSFKSI